MPDNSSVWRRLGGCLTVCCWAAVVWADPPATQPASTQSAATAPAESPVPGVLTPGASVRKLADGFKFVEGPAWDPVTRALYFTDIPPANIVCYRDGKAEVVDADSGQANGLMFTRDGQLVACEHKTRRVSRGAPTGGRATLAERFDNLRLNSPNDLWMDASGGIYFTDPRYGSRDDLEQKVEAVYYLAADGTLTRIIAELVRPNGIALSPRGDWLYVVDNGADLLMRYPVSGPGLIGPGSRLAEVRQPDGMTVDQTGRLYVTAQPGVMVFEPDGRHIGTIAVPEQPANCTFGGPDSRTLFITARTSLYAVDTLTRGWHVHLDGVPTQPAP